MHKYQLSKWLQDPKRHHRSPKVYLISCGDLPQYLVAVEYKQRVEPVKSGNQPLQFQSLKQAKQALNQLGAKRAYLRMQNAYDECGTGQRQRYCDMELALSRD